MTGPWPWFAAFLATAILGLVLAWAHPSLSTPTEETGAAETEQPVVPRSRGFAIPQPPDPAAPDTGPPTTAPSLATPDPIELPIPLVELTPTFSDTFEGAAATWGEDETVGQWHVQYDGYGHVGLTGDGRLQLKPRAVDSPDATTAAMVTSTRTFAGDIDIFVRANTAAQLRTGSPPNPWEVAWVVWHFQHDHRFYYTVLTPNGWELGKVDNTKLDAAGPECVWPSYENCKYPGAQRFLATGLTPSFGIGEWHDIRISQSGNAIALFGDGQELTRYVDSDEPYRDGHVGLYTEDGDVSYDAIFVTETSDEDSTE